MLLIENIRYFKEMSKIIKVKASTLTNLKKDTHQVFYILISKCNYNM